MTSRIPNHFIWRRSQEFSPHHFGCLQFLAPRRLLPLLVHLLFLPGLHQLSSSHTTRDFQHELGQVKSLEVHLLPSDLWSIDKSLQEETGSCENFTGSTSRLNFQEADQKAEGILARFFGWVWASTWHQILTPCTQQPRFRFRSLDPVCSFSKNPAGGRVESTHPVLIEDVDDGHNLALVGSVGHVCHTANLNETLKALKSHEMGQSLSEHTTPLHITRKHRETKSRFRLFLLNFVTQTGGILHVVFKVFTFTQHVTTRNAKY